jgi:hypothetical protein
MTAFDGFDVDSLEDSPPGLFEVPRTEKRYPDETFDEPDETLLKTPRRKRGEAEYAKKMHTGLSVLTKLAIEHEPTRPDAAALLMYGPDLANSMGRLAAEDARVANMIDMLTEGATNPYAAVLMAATPLLLQVIRNHEPTFEPKNRGFKIPFTKGRRTWAPRFKIGLRLGNLRGMTHEPDVFTDSVFNRPQIRKVMMDLGMVIDNEPSVKPTRSPRAAKRTV